MTLRDRITGFILGTAVGDSLGLPREGLSRRRSERLFGSGPLEHRLFLGHGMLSDDTEHTCMVSQALLASGGDPDSFTRSLSWRLRGWLAALPAGVGLATLKSCARLWMGFSWRSSGVFSAGNGPAMRSGLLGMTASDDGRMRELVHRSTRITHTDPLAEDGALLIALAARHAATLQSPHPNVDLFLSDAMKAIRDDRFRASLDLMATSLHQRHGATEFADALGLSRGVSGYILHTVPICLFCWLRYSTSFREGLEAVVALGGDTDTTGAITGGLLGASLGVSGIPAEWLAQLRDWPRSVSWMKRLGDRLGDLVERNSNDGPLPLCWPAIPLRNVLFTSIVLAHGFRRLLPPY